MLIKASGCLRRVTLLCVRSIFGVIQFENSQNSCATLIQVNGTCADNCSQVAQLKSANTITLSLEFLLSAAVDSVYHLNIC